MNGIVQRSRQAQKHRGQKLGTDQRGVGIRPGLKQKATQGLIQTVEGSVGRNLLWHIAPHR